MSHETASMRLIFRITSEMRAKPLFATYSSIQINAASGANDRAMVLYQNVFPREAKVYATSKTSFPPTVHFLHRCLLFFNHKLFNSTCKTWQNTKKEKNEQADARSTTRCHFSFPFKSSRIFGKTIRMELSSNVD